MGTAESGICPRGLLQQSAGREPPELEQKSFLLSQERSSDEILEVSYTRLAKRRSNWRRAKIDILTHSILIAFYTIVTISIVRARSRTEKPPHGEWKLPSNWHPSLSGHLAVFDNLETKYTQTVFHHLANNSYAGEPSLELDAAWDALLSPMHMRVSEDELRRDDQESVKLPEGGGYLSWMGVFHELHCIVSQSTGKVFHRFGE
ncbi:uncharacterized protein KY384_004206 [Bacidia gigantensis]|uniref:uncharacterized protein n=1 Tax=Bacidia gigantensis TaxID=2732470 RepID=UPI001D05855F|nr:uncharacterized protein KY384_004206 [Bacidia gigantensis]KAG8530849.1 hypothetical protein KY384_004206 [Bacidia gigantensis]